MGSCCDDTTESKISYKLDDVTVGGFTYHKYETIEKVTKDGKPQEVEIPVLDEKWNTRFDICEPVDKFPDLPEQVARILLKMQDNEHFSKMTEPVIVEPTEENPYPVNIPVQGPFKVDNRDHYYGQVYDGTRNNWGKQLWDNKSFYMGYWKNNICESWGVIFSIF